MQEHNATGEETKFEDESCSWPPPPDDVTGEEQLLEAERSRCGAPSSDAYVDAAASASGGCACATSAAGTTAVAFDFPPPPATKTFCAEALRLHRVTKAAFDANKILKDTLFRLRGEVRQSLLLPVERGEAALRRQRGSMLRACKLKRAEVRGEGCVLCPVQDATPEPFQMQNMGAKVLGKSLGPGSGGVG